MFNTFLAAAGGLGPPDDLMNKTDYTIPLLIAVISSLLLIAIIMGFVYWFVNRK